ncbi:MAG: SDR family oxidoreductase [Myxococcota bacterium]
MTAAAPSTSELRGRALITGATSGIGRQTALALVRQGWEVFATGIERDRFAALEQEAGPGLVALYLDVTDPASIAAAHAEVQARTHGHSIDVLINNAGYGAAGPTESFNDAAVQAQFEVNVFGLLRVVRAFVPDLRAKRQGRVINISSLGGLFTLPMLGVYNATKYAVEALSDALRMELRPFGIEVVLIEPAMIHTGFADRSMREAKKLEDPSSPYAPIMAESAALRAEMERTAYPVHHVVAAIERAIYAARPRARYAAPRRAGWAVAVLRMLPTWLLDAILSRLAGLSALRGR